MLTVFHPIHPDYLVNESLRDLRRALAKKRAASSTISTKEFEQRRRARKAANKQRARSRRLH